MAKWKEEEVQRVVANPVCVGIGPYPAIVDKKLWVAAASKMMSEVGQEKFLEIMLEELQKAFAFAE
jgi:hypothetical protein